MNRNTRLRWLAWETAVTVTEIAMFIVGIVYLFRQEWSKANAYLLLVVIMLVSEVDRKLRND